MVTMTSYAEFLSRKTHSADLGGFDPTWLPDAMKPFQRHGASWAIRRGRAALFEECGLGKSLQELVWAENVVRHTNKPVLLATPLAVGSQMLREAAKFGIDATRSQDGRFTGTRVVVTNYERLEHFDPSDFGGFVGDESSGIKAYGGETRKRVTRFLTKLPYRLLASATPSPNDYTELGTHSEALGELSHSEMLRRFFKYLDDKGQKRDHRKQLEAERLIESNPNYFKKLAFRVSQTIGQWRLKHHAIEQFWRWVASWAMACRKPSDWGFGDDGYALPPLTENRHVIEAGPPPGYLFPAMAKGLHAERQERRRTLAERCEYVVRLVAHDRPAVVWCHTNDEGDLLEKVIPGSKQIAGKTPDDEKVQLYDAFASGELRVLVIKPKIGAWGLNWQHCNHVVTFASHSLEQHHQLVRRCWRFGQTRPVTVDIIATEGEVGVLDNQAEKAKRMDVMFEAMVEAMSQSVRVRRENIYTSKIEVPQWA